MSQTPTPPESAAAIDAASAQQPAQSPDQTPARSGGPGADNGAIVIPKKKDPRSRHPLPRRLRPRSRIPNGENLTPRVDVPDSQVSMWAYSRQEPTSSSPDSSHANFRVLRRWRRAEGGRCASPEAPITALMLCEFAANGWYSSTTCATPPWAFTARCAPRTTLRSMTYDLQDSHPVGLHQTTQIIAQSHHNSPSSCPASPRRICSMRCTRRSTA